MLLLSKGFVWQRVDYTLVNMLNLANWPLIIVNDNLLGSFWEVALELWWNKKNVKFKIRKLNCLNSENWSSNHKIGQQNSIKQLFFLFTNFTFFQVTGIPMEKTLRNGFHGQLFNKPQTLRISYSWEWFKFYFPISFTSKYHWDFLKTFSHPDLFPKVFQS